MFTGDIYMNGPSWVHGPTTASINNSKMADGGHIVTKAPGRAVATGREVRESGRE